VGSDAQFGRLTRSGALSDFSGCPENHARGGNSEVRWLANLLYLYNKPFDIVVDTFASGETVS
jgi:hypothetical protein